MDQDIVSIVKSLWLFLALPFYAYLGAFTLYVLNRINEKQPFSLFRALNIDVISKTASPKIILWDMVFSSTLGAIVVVALVSPATVPQAIIAGLGMTGILAAHTKQTSQG